MNDIWQQLVLKGNF